MGKETGISWTDSTWNPWRGCLKISPGCKLCYMYREQSRFGNDPKVVTRSKTTFFDPLKWNEPARVFTCSFSDFFIDQADEWREEVWHIINQTPHLTYQILTKRPENILSRLPENWGSGWSNVWLGVSVESPAYYHRLDTLLDIPAVVHFVSYEPALAPISLVSWLTRGLDWVISGGESDKVQPRPADMNWFKSVRDECLRFNVPYFHKQNGGKYKVNGTWGGHLLDGIEWFQFPI